LIVLAPISGKRLFALSPWNKYSIEQKSMKTIILAAGKATRLLPLTKDTPQSLLEVNGKAILERQVENLKKSGIRDIVVVTGHLSEKIEELCKGLGVKTLFNPFYAVSGIAVSLWAAKEELANGFLLLYSDVLFDSFVVDGLLESAGDICLAVKKNDLRNEAEKVVEQEGFIKSVKKIPSGKENGEFIGIAKFSSSGALEFKDKLNELLRKSLDVSFIDVVDDFIKTGGLVAAYDIKNASFADIDFPEDLTEAENIFL